jgi:ComF family protein
MLFEHIIGLISPHHCLVCSREGTLLCPNCFAALPQARERCYICQKTSPGGRTCATCSSQTAVKFVQSLVAYQGAAKDMLWQLKSERARAAANIIGRQCAALIQPNTQTIITFIPTAPIRVRQRGYDQAKCIAKTVAQCSSLPVASLLARTSSNRQVGADAKTRRKQLVQAFRPINTYLAHDKHIILVDDVITTGSSIRAAADVLVAAGARSISAVTFAQA